MSLAPCSEWRTQDLNPKGIITVNPKSNWQPRTGFSATTKSGGVLNAPPGGLEEHCQLSYHGPCGVQYFYLALRVQHSTESCSGDTDKGTLSGFQGAFLEEVTWSRALKDKRQRPERTGLVQGSGRSFVWEGVGRGGWGRSRGSSGKEPWPWHVALSLSLELVNQKISKANWKSQLFILPVWT